MIINIYLVSLVVNLLSGAFLWIGASRLWSRRINKNAAQRLALIVAIVLTLGGLSLMTWAYIYIEDDLCYVAPV